MATELKIKLVKSPIGAKRNQKETLKALGLTRMQKEVTRKDCDTVRGMIRCVAHLVEVEEI